MTDPTTKPRRRRLPLSVQALIGLAAIAVLFALARGVAPVFPALAGFLRALLNPFVLVGIVLLFVLHRLGRRRPPPAGDATER